MLQVRDDLLGWFDLWKGEMVSPAVAEKRWGAAIYRESERPDFLLPFFSDEEGERLFNRWYATKWGVLECL